MRCCVPHRVHSIYETDLGPLQNRAGIVFPVFRKPVPPPHCEIELLLLHFRPAELCLGFCSEFFQARPSTGCAPCLYENPTRKVELDGFW
jgi:hypothetical protein